LLASLVGKVVLEVYQDKIQLQHPLLFQVACQLAVQHTSQFEYLYEVYLELALELGYLYLGILLLGLVTKHSNLNL
jgi:hypothetical protein